MDKSKLPPMTKGSVVREGIGAIHNPAPEGVSEKKYDQVVKTLKKKRDVDNPYALAAYITKRQKK